MRKDAGFEVTDKIKVSYTGTNKLTNAIKIFTNYISAETLAEKLEYTDRLNGGVVRDWKIGEHNCKIQIEKIST